MILRISEEIKTAMKEQNKERLLVLRSLKTELKNKEIDLCRPLTEEEGLDVVRRCVKSREQAIELYEKGGRPELALKEKEEIALLQVYLPQTLTEEEIEKEVDLAIQENPEITVKDMGKLMKILSAKLGSRADGKTLSSIVRKKLST